MTENKVIKGYKVFNPDWTCSPSGKPFKYEVGKTYECDGKPKVCNRGFHFCRKLIDCFNFYKFDAENKVAEVIALGDVDSDGVKCCTNKIQIVRETPWSEVLDIVNSGTCNTGNRNAGNCNTGNWNAGDCNTGGWNAGGWNAGDWNTGDWNAGNCNTGNWNTGNWNAGDWNTGDWNAGNRNTGNWNAGDWNKCSFSSGCFNTEEAKILMFNRPSDWTFLDWYNSEARRLMGQIKPKRLEWVRSLNMTDEEKAAHPEHETTGGYLKESYESDGSQLWWNGLNDSQKAVIMALPNFDKAIFKEITGIDIDYQEDETTAREQSKGGLK